METGPEKGIPTQVALNNDDSFDEFHHFPYRWVILAIYCVINFVFIYSVMGIAGMANRFIGSFGITVMQFSMLQTIPSLAGFFLSFFAGGLSDRFGVKVVMVTGVACGVVGCVARAFVFDNYIILSISNFIVGIGMGAMNATVQKVVNAWFTPKQYNFGLGLYVAVATFGAALALSSAVFFAELAVFMRVCAIAMVILLIVVAIFLKDKPEGMPSITDDNYLALLKETLKNGSVWFSAILYFLLYGAYVALCTFLVMCIMSKGVPEAQAGLISTGASLGCAFGSIVLSGIIAKTGHTRTWLIVTSFVCTALLAVAWNMPFGVFAVALLFSAMFVCGSVIAQVKALPAQLPNLPQKYVGSASGFQAALQNLGGFVIPTYFVAVIAGSNYQLMLNVVVGVFLLCAIITFFLPKKVGLQ